MLRTLPAGLLLIFIGAFEALAQPFIEVQEGSYPVILSVPHGGYLVPDSLADRTCTGCVTVRDSRTQEWARALADGIEMRTGARPWVIINLLDRVKLDANRDLDEAADGDPHAAAAWALYHEALETASRAVSDEFEAGLVLDLHGHGHEQPRFELGYLISATRLREPDGSLNLLGAQSSIRALLARSGHSLSALTRGTNSFGEFLQRAGVPATPSASDPAPLQGQAFFSGGYITARHGSREGGTIDAIQLEAHWPGARDSQANVEELAERVADATVAFMGQWYAGLTQTGFDQDVPTGSECLWLQGEWLNLAHDCPGGSTTVYDMLGRRVTSLAMAPGDRLALPTLARGIYLARYRPLSSMSDRLTTTITVVR